MRFLCGLLAAAGLVRAQPFLRNEITFSAGQSWEVFKSFTETDTAVSLGGTYGYRVLKNVEVTAGAFVVLNPTPPDCASFGCSNGDNRFVWIPFGARFILPLKHDRYELSAGGGGLWEHYTVVNPNTSFGASSYGGWGGYLAVSAAMALDRGRHFWISGTPRWILANPGHVRDRWFMITGDISFRF
jgi:hypothetical protein